MGSELNISSVAVIGAGISGVVAAAHLKQQGITVTVYERNHASGGVWLFDERLPPEPTFPSTKPSIAEKTPQDVESSLLHAPPGPCYSSLMNNVSTGMLQTSLLQWPEGTPASVKHYVLKEYIQDISKTTGVNELTHYDTRVKELKKTDGKWNLVSEELRPDGEININTSSFDAVVVASGHYHAPRVPDKPGLKEWKIKWPDRIIHSKSYRYPEGFKGKNVLIIGAGVSSLDIAKDISPYANKIWQTSRGGDFDLPGNILPENGTQVADVESFELPVEGQTKSELQDDEPIPLTVTLTTGEKLCQIHTVIIATGYHITLPFLSYLHQDNVKPEDVDDKTIVSDGTMYHNLHKDIFYIPDPTLSFIGVPYYTATFSLFDFQAKLLGLVYSGQVSIPSTEDLREEYQKRVRDKGLGRSFNSLKGKEEEYVDELAEWANKDLIKKGKPVFTGHTDSWKREKVEQLARMEKLFGGDKTDPAVVKAALALIACT
ncbi:Flavin adenine dinucleotide binding [Pleurostoma richardsiae]|uniref:Flavin adenine dinucleotide binding n=1 Tax=Pleurostoma richardsiae TaxID=41990 RepID=A0AA38RU75_9PEZI|nr:Flavin adenine dinucleotide binding [Pleurostoma richardsiae]